MDHVSELNTDQVRIAERVRTLIAQLDSLLDGAEAAARLVACGTAAIRPLREFLIECRPRGVFQPRLWAVQALGGLGADDVLVEYLCRPIGSDDAVVRFAEQTVRSAAAKALTTSERPDVSHVLVDVARNESLPGALEALAARDQDAALPILIRALADDFARDAAQAALRARGALVRDALIDAALDPGNGTESGLRRRRASLELLSEIGVDEDSWQRLECLLNDADPLLVCAVSLLGAACSPDPARIAGRLLHVLPNVGWEWLGTVEDTVVTCARRAGLNVASLLPAMVDARTDVLRAYRRISRRVTDEKNSE